MSETTNPHERHGSATDVPGEILRGVGGYPVTEKMRWCTPLWLYRALDAEFRFDLDACAEDGCHLARRWITHEEDALVVDWRMKFRQRFGGERDDYLSGEPTLVELDPEERSPVRTAFLNPPWAANGLPEWITDRHPYGLTEAESAEYLARWEADRAAGRTRKKRAPFNWTAFPGTGAFVERAWAMSRLGITSAVLLPQAMDAAWFKPLVILADELRVGRRYRFLDVRGQEGPQPPGGHMLLVFRPHVPEKGWPGGPRVEWDWRPDGEPS